MAHELDINDGQTSFVSAREDAWHKLGTVLPEVFTAEQAMEHGLLGGWNVRKVPTFAAAETGEMLEMEDRYAVIRDNPVTAGQIDVIGNVGKVYQVIQNEQHAALLNALVDESGAHFETAGALNGGRRVFITMKLPGHMKIGGSDQVDNYIAAMNSHDGSTPFTIMVTPVRVVCQNTLNVAFGNAKQMFRARHTRSADKIIINEAREALDMTFDYLEEFQEQANRMVNQTVTQSQFEQIIAKEFGTSEDAPAATVTRTENKLDEMVRLFADANTQEGIRDTAWAAFGALTEWADHFAPTRGEDRDDARAQKAILDPAFKEKALKLFSVV